MIPTQTIGRFEIVVADVAAIQRRSGFWGWLLPGYNVFLSSGLKLRMTAVEKAELDAHRQLHQDTIAVMGMIDRMQTLNRPA